ncbi:enoyl-CoA hydratase-related protein [Siminovitchia sediminis]|uniref:Enoyl-CoA hydratase-related protein n=1 Tax=Siminovitchia sediminis TaxID=1274353 RepID=A0ABW4KMK0_9BACI
MKHIQLNVEDFIATVIINRPGSLNAFNYETLCELGETADKIKTDNDIRVVIFTGAGEKAFSVGADLKERKTLSEQEVRRNVHKIGDVFQAIEKLPQPTIAAMNGHAFGGGMELALACDFRIAAKEAMMGLTETSLAIIPGAGGTQRLPRLIGESKAMELILTAKRMTAEEAYGYGVVTGLADRTMLMDKVMELAHAILANGPVAVRQAKYAIKTGMNTDVQTGLEIERKAYELTIPTEDRIEALRAFSEKRKPVYQGK